MRILVFWDGGSQFYDPDSVFLQRDGMTVRFDFHFFGEAWRLNWLTSNEKVREDLFLSLPLLLRGPAVRHRARGVRVVGHAAGARAGHLGGEVEERGTQLTSIGA